MLCDQDSESYLLAIHKDSGKIAWRTVRPEAVHGFATPSIFHTRQGSDQVIVPGSYQLTAYSATTGERLWWVRGLTWQVKPTAVVSGDPIYATGWAPGADAGERQNLPPFEEVLKEGDKDGDGKLSPSEVPERLRHKGSWNAIDLGRDGFLDARDWSFYRARRAAQNVTMPETESELIPLSPMRRVIAQRMVESKTTTPHFYLTVELDVAKLLELRAQANESLTATGGGKLSINDFVLKACVECLQRVPQLNSSFSQDGILRYTHVHLGFAVSLEEGLITPVLRNAERKTLRQLSTEAKEMTERARAKKLKPDEYQGGTFTVSNLGASGIDSFQAIINPPQSGILAVGSVMKKAVVNANDQIVVGQRLNVTLCCDHRVVDGAVGAKFLQEFRALIENPTLMLL